MNRLMLISILLFFVILTGCNPWPVAMQIRMATSAYDDVAHLINIGDSKERVLDILLPTQKRLSAHLKKPPERTVIDGKSIEVYFMRSGWQSDGRTTDDEFTPYVFVDNRLVAIGWNAMRVYTANTGKE